MKSCIDVGKITVLSGFGTDKIIIETDLPNGIYPYTGNATVTLEVARGTGIDYVRKQFECEPNEVYGVPR